MKSIVLIIFLYVLIAVNSGDAQVQYQVIDLGTLGGNSSRAYDINELTQIVGVAKNNSGEDRAFLWQDGNMINLETLGGDFSWAYGLNNAGQVVGQTNLNNGSYRAFLWQNGMMENLGTLGGDLSGAVGINDLGQVVGGSEIPAGNTRAFLWQNNNMIDLGTLNNVHSSVAYKINEMGQVVGVSKIASGASRAFLWQDGTMENLGTLGGDYSEALDINNLGQVVGFATNSDDNIRPFLWQNGNMIELDNLGNSSTRAFGINDSGHVVGYDNQQALFWRDGMIINLNDIIDPSSGWILREAHSINNNGQIVGWGTFNGQVRAFLLIKEGFVFNPGVFDKFIAGETDTIKWTNMGWQFINIKCMLNYGTPDSSEFVIENFYLADSSIYVWNILDNLLSYRSKIIIENGNNTEQKIESEIFRIKPYVLTRVTSDSLYYDYQKSRDQWTFRNSAEDMWDSTWYQQFDYKGLDPFTGMQYSQLQVDSAFARAASKDHPDWISWVNTFTVDACYVDVNQGFYSLTALAKWKATKGNWRGSCFGIATANAMAFSYREEFQNKYPNYPAFLYPISVVSDSGVKRVVNELYTHQLGKPHWPYVVENWSSTSPNETLDNLKNILMQDKSEIATLSFWHNTRSAGHNVLPYGLKRNAVQNHIYYIQLYDNSHPFSNNPITINTSANGGNGSWSTPDWGSWGGNGKIIIMNPVSEYFQNPTLNKNSNYLSPFIMGDTELQILNRSSNDIIIRNNQGETIGYVNGNILENIPSGVPLILLNGSETPPYGYHLPTDNYSVMLNEFAEDTINAFFFTGNKSFSYSRTGASQNHTDRLFFDGGVSAVNPDAQSKTVKLLNIINETTQEKLFTVRSLQLVQNDSVKIENPDDEKLKLISYGSQKNYDIELNYVSQNGVGRFGDFNIPLSANTSHTFVPDWQNLETTPLVVLVDIGNNGTIDDTLYIINTVDVEDQGSLLNPDSYNLAQNYPNPFNPVTTIRYSIPQSGFVSLKVYDVLGREVAALVNEEKSPGVHEVQFDGSSFASGVYYYRLTAGSFLQTKKLMLVK